MKVRSGIDSVHIPRIEKLLEKSGDSFIDRTYTEAEEADFEIITDGAGAPEIVFHGKAKERAQELHVTSSSVSITHEKDYAAAVCVLLCDEEV